MYGGISEYADELEKALSSSRSPRSQHTNIQPELQVPASEEEELDLEEESEEKLWRELNALRDDIYWKMGKERDVLGKLRTFVNGMAHNQNCTSSLSLPLSDSRAWNVGVPTDIIVVVL